MNMPLIPEQRHRELLRLVRGAGVVSTRQLATLLHVSNMTVRRDIAGLEETGLVESVLGGVRLAQQTSIAGLPRERQSRASLEIPRKKAIAAHAAEYVHAGMVVFLDAGTTCQELVPYLGRLDDVTVVTNDLYTTLALGDLVGTNVIHTGGSLDATSGSTSGTLAKSIVGAVRLDIAFISTGAWEIRHGVTTPDLDKVALKTHVLTQAARSVLLADSTKYGLTERFKVTPLEALDIIVSDSDLPDAAVTSLNDLGVDVQRAQMAGRDIREAAG